MKTMRMGLAKSVFEALDLIEKDKAVLANTLRLAAVTQFFADWGHEFRAISPQLMTLCVKSNKKRPDRS